ncbi:MAG: chemotaxis protein CheW [Deltaproteobacteria bacterium]|nr:chemotaxis protein CheW [Deltaproteobacteria bacterium]MBW2110667.1 chemotaxis protein CheW [Deltaproteobacteria bacterium]
MAREERCWKRIGVWGKEEPRCPLLEEVIHCRNCELFTRAGRNLLERELPAQYGDEWGRVLLKEKSEEPLGSFPVVTFRVGKEWLALPAGIFSEIIDRVPFHTVPHRRSDVLLGVVNVHGEIQICVSLKHLLGLEDEPHRDEDPGKSQDRMMVVEKDGDVWVFPVEEIHGIHRVRPDLFQNLPVTLSKSKAAFTRDIFEWESGHVALLDDEFLFYNLKRSLQ